MKKVRTSRYVDQEVHTYMQVPRSEGTVPRIHSLQGKEACSRGVYHVWPVVLSPSIMILWFWSVVLFLLLLLLLSPKFFGPLYWFSMVLRHGFSKGSPIKGKGDHLASHL